MVPSLQLFPYKRIVMYRYRILVINPGSTSTKISVFEDEREVLSQTLRHTSEELAVYPKVADQFAFRKELILAALREASIPVESLSAVIGRGGLIKPVPSGVYEVNEALKRDLIHPPQGEHASNLGGLIAADIADSIEGVKAYIADPVVVDELSDVARIVGHPLFERRSIFHALNQKAVAHVYADRIGKKYEELNLVVAHLGGGISVGAHQKGKVIDVNNALDGEGPYSPERSGTLPAGQLATLCFSGKYTEAEVKKMICGAGGLVSLLGSNNMIELTERAQNGDSKVQLYLEGMFYNVGKGIGAMVAALDGEVDAILLTGGMAHRPTFCAYIRKMCGRFAPIEIFPGEDEMQALSENALRVLKGDLQAHMYQ